MSGPAAMHGVLRHLRRTELRRLYHLLDDRELLARFLADRDEAAFEEVVTRHGPMVRAVCRRVLGPTADADDAFQAAFLVLIRRARLIRKADLLAGWLCAVAYRTARQALRRRSRLGARERLLDEQPEPLRFDDPPRDWLPLFDAALQRLPAKYREPVVLCELQGVSRRDASLRLGLSEGTLSSRLGRARDLLRRKLDRFGFPLAFGSALAPAVVPEALTASTSAAAVHVSAASVSAIVLTEGVLTAMLASKLKVGALAGSAVLFFGVVAGIQFSGPASGAGGPPGKDGSPTKEASLESAKTATQSVKPPPVAAEFEPFQGQWEVSAAERDGVAVSPRGAGIDETWSYAGNALTTGGEAKADATERFTVDPKAKPATIDFSLTQFDGGGTGALMRTQYQGIYRFDPDGRLLICYRKRADNILRPTRFATAHNSGAIVVTLRRPEPKQNVPLGIAIDFAYPVTMVDSGTVQKAIAKNPDLGHVVGAWELADVDGQSPEAAVSKPRPKQRWEGLRRLQLLPGTGPMDLTNSPGANSYVAYVELDGTRNPKWFTLHSTETLQATGPGGLAGYSTHAIRLCGIYKLDGEKLMICLPEAEGSPLLRPTDFKGDGEGGLYLLTYQRAAKTWKTDPKIMPSPAPTMPPLATGDSFLRPLAPSTIGPVAPASDGSPFGPVPGGPAPSPPDSVRAISPNIPSPVLNVAPPEASVPPAISVEAPPRAPEAVLPAAKAEAVSQTDLERLQGDWDLALVDGKPATAPAELESFEILKDRILLSDGTHGRVTIDESKSPRQIKIILPKQADRPMVAIYKFDGERLTIATCPKSGKLVPAGFETDAEAGITVSVFERAKPILPPLIRPGTKADPPPKQPARDLQKEIDQLRDQLKRLEKELKDRTD